MNEFEKSEKLARFFGIRFYLRRLIYEFEQILFKFEDMVENNRSNIKIFKKKALRVNLEFFENQAKALHFNLLPFSSYI